MKRLLAALAIVALAGGCMKIGSGSTKDLPAYVRIYPGGQPMANMNLGDDSSQLLTTPDPPDKVIAWYRAQALSDGLQEGQAPPPKVAPASQRQAVFGDQASNRMLVVVARPQEDAEKPVTMVDLTYTTPGTAPGKAPSP